jgi:hypothetical protein
MIDPFDDACGRVWIDADIDPLSKDDRHFGMAKVVRPPVGQVDSQRDERPGAQK